jgi:hypothetical protein
MDTAYHPDFGTEVRYSFERMPEDPYGQVRHAVQKAIPFIRQDAFSAPIQEDARRAARGGDPIAGVWNHIKPSIKFKQDVDIAKDLDVQDPRKEADSIVEVFIRPVDQSMLIGLRGVGVEDCDGFTMYGACLLTALGIPCALVTVAADPDRPREFSHIYVAAYPQGPRGIRIPLDFSHGEYPGWECPSTRKREWPVWETGIEKATTAVAPLAIAGALYCAFRWLNNRRAG